MRDLSGFELQAADDAPALDRDQLRVAASVGRPGGVVRVGGQVGRQPPGVRHLEGRDCVLVLATDLEGHAAGRQHRKISAPGAIGILPLEQPARSQRRALGVLFITGGFISGHPAEQDLSGVEYCGCDRDREPAGAVVERTP